MQPTYMPWIGYFALMQQADAFVLLDDVQFSHQSWQHRNRIRSSGSSQWLTVPVLVKGRGSQHIDEVLIDNAKPWRKKHLRTILQSYARSPWLQKYRPWLERVYGTSPQKLGELNEVLIEDLARMLGIDTPLLRSSALKVRGDRVERLVRMCQKIGADEYLSPIGSYDYIESDNRFPEAGIRLVYQHYEHPRYRQIQGEFVAYQSVLDLLLNEGPASLEILSSGTRRPYSSDELRSLRREGQHA